MFPRLPDVAAIHRLQDLARSEARRLRREAVDDFWKGLGAWCPPAGAAIRARAQGLVARFKHLTQKA